jgi:fructose-bisphosphate aldolase class II
MTTALRSGTAVRMPTLSAMLHHARAGGYAVPAFNVVDQVTMAAALDTAARLRSPVVIQASVRTASFWGPAELRAVFQAHRATTGARAVLHLDHCADPQLILRCARAGWESALFDVSERPYPDAVAATREVVTEAAGYGTEIEGEFERIGRIGEVDGDGGPAGGERCREFVAATGVACLSPDLGTRHGAYDHDPRVRYELARELAATVPVVLHGGSGLSAASLHDAVAAGVSKINVSTAIKTAYLTTVRAAAARVDAEPLDLAETLLERVGAVCEAYIDRSGSRGRWA